MRPKGPDEARNAVTPYVGGAPRRTARHALASRRSLAIGLVLAATVGAWGLTSALSSTASSGGAPLRGEPNLASYHRHNNASQTASATANSQFTIAGTASKVLYPGTRSSIDLAFTNTTGTAITLPATAITITITSPRPTNCPATPNFSVVHTLTTAITIPADVTSDSLSDMGITARSWPVISMVTTHVTQDACQAMTLSLRYSATVTTTTPATAGTTGTGSGSGSQSGGSSSVPVETAGATSGGLAFTGLDVALLAGSGALLLLAGIGLLTWRRRRLGARH